MAWASSWNIPHCDTLFSYPSRLSCTANSCLSPGLFFKPHTPAVSPTPISRHASQAGAQMCMSHSVLPDTDWLFLLPLSLWSSFPVPLVSLLVSTPFPSVVMSPLFQLPPWGKVLTHLQLFFLFLSAYPVTWRTILSFRVFESFCQCSVDVLWGLFCL